MQRATDGWGSGLLGVIIFSGSLPATRLAVGGFTPLFLTSARAIIAALLGAALLLALRQTRPERQDLVPLAVLEQSLDVSNSSAMDCGKQRVTRVIDLR